MPAAVNGSIIDANALIVGSAQQDGCASLDETGSRKPRAARRLLQLSFRPLLVHSRLQMAVKGLNLRKAVDRTVKARALTAG